MLNMRQKGSVAILMGTYNGASYIEKQFNSIRNQEWDNWSLWVSDDGSNDKTRSILESMFSSVDNKCVLLRGPEKGFCENFKSLIGNKEIVANFYAFADQDDIWHPQKLTRALSYLNSLSDDIPAMYCSRTQLIDEEDNVIGFSPMNKKKPGFANALLQNIASGNTMVFNEAARQLFQTMLALPLIAHDWALYLLVSACGGHVFYDPTPTVLYRQHNANLIGNGMKFTTRLSNFFDAYRGRNRHWNDVNFRLLESISAQITQENKFKYHAFKQIRNGNLFHRLKSFQASGVYHQNRLGQMTNFSYALFNKF